MAVAEIRIIPVGTESPSYSSYISACYRLARETPGVRHQVTPTGTVVSGDVADILDLARRMHRATLEAGAGRVVTEVTIDERRDRQLDPAEMVETVLEEAGAAPVPACP